MVYLLAVLTGLAGLIAGVLTVARLQDRDWREAWRPRIARPRDVVVPLACVAGCVLVAVRFGAAAVLPAYVYLVVVGLALAAVDAEEHRLPNKLTLPSYPVALGLLAIAAFSAGWTHLVAALVGMGALWLLYALLFLISPSGIGWGDVKLAGVLGIYLGWLGAHSWVLGTFLGVLLGGLFALALVIGRRAGRKTMIPFGPFMIAGALIAVIVSGYRIVL